jgi:hypothetical protein
MLINNICYIPGFYTNIISTSTMQEANLFPDLKHDVVRQHGGEIFYKL